MELKDAILTTKGQFKGSTESSVQNSSSKAQNSADLTDITMGILSIFSNAIINQISMNYDVAEIKIHYNLTGKRTTRVEGCTVVRGRRRLTDVRRLPVCVLTNSIKMLTLFSNDLIIILNIPAYTRTTNYRNKMEQYLWFQEMVLVLPFGSMA